MSFILDRVPLLNGLITLRNLKSYLEIGVRHGATFHQVILQRKTGVDPALGTSVRHKSQKLHQMTSDEFFEKNKRRFDLVFIDGLHLAEQALRDVKNSLNCLEKNGVIVLHDTKPLFEIQQQRTPSKAGGWCGDVWKVVPLLKQQSGLKVATLDVDVGLTVVVPRTYPVTVVGELEDLSWDEFNLYKTQLLGLIPPNWSALKKAIL